MQWLYLQHRHPRRHPFSCVNIDFCSQAVGAVTSVDLTMDGMYLLASSRHGPVRTWDVRMGRPLLRYKVWGGGEGWNIWDTALAWVFAVWALGSAFTWHFITENVETVDRLCLQ